MDKLSLTLFLLQEKITCPAYYADIIQNREGKGNNTMTRYEQETIINFNAQDLTAILYTRDKAVMRKMDSLVAEYPDHYCMIEETDIDRTYELPKSFVSYRKPRKISEEHRNAARERMLRINGK